jgi:hypothetical protein
MSKVALDMFGRVLMSKVRDEAISDWKMIVDGRMKGEFAAKSRRALVSFSEDQRRAFLSLVPEVVDTVLHHLLWMLEQEDNIRVGVTSFNEIVPDLRDVSDGLAGELPSDQGWIARFSREA